MNELSKLLKILETFTCGTGASTTGCGGNDDDVLDVEDLEYSDDYKTQYSPYCENDDEIEDDINESLNLKEQDEPPVETPEAPVEVIKKKETEVVEPEVPEEVPTEEIPAEDVAGTEDVPGLEMPGEEDEVPRDPETLGKIYELKKIYSRLVSIESFLNDVSEPMLLKLRNFVSESIELFQLMINNVDIFKDRIDEIIVLYYKFLRIVYELLKQFYEKENKEDKEKIKRGK